jgi:diguanylate cyclase (GGDEF)-like protein
MKNIRIMIVEDERIIAEDIKRILLKYRYEVVAVTASGKEAVAAADIYQPDVILMDIVLQGEMSGIDASRKINQSHSIPIIYITSFLDKNALAKTKNLESYAYLMKPFEDKELYATIELAVYKFRMETILLDYKNKIEKLHEVTTKMAAAEKIEEIFQIIQSSTKEVLDFENSIILERTEPDNELSVLVSDSQLYLDNKRYIIPPDLLQELNKKEFVVFDFDKEMPDFIPVHQDRSLLLMNFERVGFLMIFSQPNSSFSKNEINMLGLMLRHASVDIRRMQLQKELKMRALKDSMTGCYNRFYLFTALEREMKKARRDQSSIAFLMIDVNGLKKVNDQFGHHYGDQFLITVANILKETSRETDIVVRYGGDEFLIMMPETEMTAKIVVERILAKAEQWNADNPESVFQVSFAVGCAYWNEDCNCSIEDVLALADERMYEDKKKFIGRRR